MTAAVGSDDAMGIKGLFPYLVEAAPGAYNTTELKRYSGRRLAIDASGWMYQPGGLALRMKEKLRGC